MHAFKSSLALSCVVVLWLGDRIVEGCCVPCDGCPCETPVCTWLAGEPIDASFTPACIELCIQPNPPGLDINSPEAWGDYAIHHWTVFNRSDLDLYRHESYYWRDEDPNQGDEECKCRLTLVECMDSDERFHLEWSGTVNLEQPGHYELTCIIMQLPESGDCPHYDESTTLTFDIDVVCPGDPLVAAAPDCRNSLVGARFQHYWLCPDGGVWVGWHLEDVYKVEYCNTGEFLVNTVPFWAIRVDDDIFTLWPPAAGIPCTDRRIQSSYLGPTEATVAACLYPNEQVIQISSGSPCSVTTTSFDYPVQCSKNCQ